MTRSTALRNAKDELTKIADHLDVVIDVLIQNDCPDEANDLARTLAVLLTDRSVIRSKMREAVTAESA